MPQSLQPLDACGFEYTNNTDKEIPNNTIVCCGLLAGRLVNCLSPGECGIAEFLAPANCWLLYCEPPITQDFRKGQPFVGPKGSQFVVLEDFKAGKPCIYLCAQPGGAAVEQCATVAIPSTVTQINSLTLSGKTITGPWTAANVTDIVDPLNAEGFGVRSAEWVDGELIIKGVDLGDVGDGQLELDVS